jgi:regulator of RNase E activity RraA
MVNSVYGGLMTARAKASGAAGTIVDGRICDLQEHRDLSYPVGTLEWMNRLQS